MRCPFGHLYYKLGSKEGLVNCYREKYWSNHINNYLSRHLKYVNSRQKDVLYTFIEHKTAIAILYKAHCTNSYSTLSSTRITLKCNECCMIEVCDLQIMYCIRRSTVRYIWRENEMGDPCNYLLTPRTNAGNGRIRSDRVANV